MRAEQTAPLILDIQGCLIPVLNHIKVHRAESRVALSRVQSLETPWLPIRFDRGDESEAMVATKFLLRTHDGEGLIRCQVDERRFEQRVALTTTPKSMGGRLFWWVCPATGARVPFLALPAGAERFLSVKGHGLDGEDEARLVAQAEAARWAAKLNPDGSRPHGMKAAQYANIVSKLAAVNARIEGPAGFLNGM